VPRRSTTPQPASRPSAAEPAASKPGRLSLPAGIDSTTLWILVGITLIGLLLRLWGIGWSLPDARHPLATYHPDELINFIAADNVDPFRGQFDLQFYNYGALFFYLVAYAWIFARGWRLVPEPPREALAPGAVSSPSLEALRAPNMAALYLAGRMVSVICGTLTIPVVFALGNRLFGRKAGLWAAALTAVAPLAVVHAHFMTVDVCATLFTALALLGAARILTQPDWKGYALAGVATGLATATKYNTALVVVAPIAAHILNRSVDHAHRTRLARLALLLVLTVAAFLAGCPGPLINWNAFWRGTYADSGVLYELTIHPQSGHGNLFTATGNGWWFHLRISLLFGLGAALLLLALAGLVRSLMRRSRRDAVLLVFVLVYYGVAGLSAVRFARYMIPLYPALFVLAGGMASEAALLRRWAKPALALISLCVLLTLAYTLELDAATAARTPQDLAADYLERTAPQNAVVAFPRLPWYEDPPISPEFTSGRMDLHPGEEIKTERLTLRMPKGDWDRSVPRDESVLRPPLDYLVVTRFDRMHDLDRLGYPWAIRFMDSIPQNMSRRTFGPPRVLLLPLIGPLLPDDLLYILPQVTIYERGRNAAGSEAR
jgi:4-amino-4-deoxy-L-arabinose transferase-like glycosyltransferase